MFVIPEGNADTQSHDVKMTNRCNIICKYDQTCDMIVFKSILGLIPLEYCKALLQISNWFFTEPWCLTSDLGNFSIQTFGINYWPKASS